MVAAIVHASMLYRVLVLLVLLATGVSTVASALAQHAPVENGQPCVAELCVDDDLASLLNLPWLDVAHGATSTVLDPSVADTLRADDDVLTAVGAYWPRHVFDKPGLSALSRVEAVCRDIAVWQRPSAEFVAGDGSRTKVVFEAEPAANGRDAVFRVAAIIRRAPEDASAASLDAPGHELERQYDSLSDYASTAAPGAHWQPDGPEGPALVLVAAVGDPQQRAAALGGHPLCESD
jgi:hypothetical protein